MILKDFFKLMNNSVFGKTMGNVQKHRDIKLVTTEKKKKLFVVRTKLSYKVFYNKPACLGLSILVQTKIVMYGFCYYYVKLRYGEKAKLCYMDTDYCIHKCK